MCRKLVEQEKKVKGEDERGALTEAAETDTEINTEGFVPPRV